MFTKMINKQDQVFNHTEFGVLWWFGMVVASGLVHETTIYICIHKRGYQISVVHILIHHRYFRVVH